MIEQVQHRDGAKDDSLVEKKNYQEENEGLRVNVELNGSDRQEKQQQPQQPQQQQQHKHKHKLRGKDHRHHTKVPASPVASKEEDGPAYHFVVSSDCSPFQRWQVLTQIHSAMSVGQAGRYTWIMSGCPEDDNDGGDINEGNAKQSNKKKSKAHGQDGRTLSRSSVLADIATHFPSLCSAAKRATPSSLGCPSVHFSPDFSDMTVYGGPYADGRTRRAYRNRNGKVTYSSYGNTYRFNNKPNGLRHWSHARDLSGEESSFDPNADEAIVLIDPDFLFLTQFNMPNVTVAPGRPAGANYGLGDQWLGFNLTSICGPTSRCVTTTKEEVYRHYSAGPPYVIHAHDVPTLSSRWSELVPPTYDQYPLLYAEMFAYSMAAADLDLPHTLVNDLFTGCMTHWPRSDSVETVAASAQRFIDAFDSSTEDVILSSGGTKSCFGSDMIPPPLLHYCQRYPFRLNDGQWRVLAKRRVAHDTLDCDHDEALLPWQDEGKEPSPRGFKRDREEYWHVLGVCAVVRGVAYAKRIGCASLA